MGRQRGIVHLSGQYDDTRMSIDGKKGIAMLSVPISKERIKNDPDFENTRKVNSEFVAAALAVDTVQKCLCGRGATFGDRYLRGRLQSKLIAMVRKGPGDNGERSLEVVVNHTGLRTFPLDKDERLHNRFWTTHAVTVNADRNVATLDVPTFDFQTGMRAAPQGATHFRILLCVGVLSDFTFVGGSDVYAAVNADMNGLNAISYSPYMECKGTNPGFQVVASVPGAPVLPGTAGLVVSIGLEYFWYVNGTPNLKAEGNVMVIHDVY